MTDLTRRTLLRVTAAAGLAGCARRIDPSREVRVGPALDGDLSVPLPAAPELSRAGGAVLVRAPGAAPVLLVNSGTGFFALRGTCPHAGCELGWVAEDRQAECPCHGSRFAGDGTVLNPPATVALDRYPVDPPDAQGNLAVHLFAGDGVFRERVQDGQVRFPIAEFPALQTVGGAILGRPDGFPGPLLVTRIAADAVAAVSAVCSHLGCTVLPAGGILQCPCHGSQFDLAGGFIQGPAGTGLVRYGASFDGTTVTVSTAPA